MSQRKLLQEIDKVFKKVKEGLEIFDGYYDKLQGCESQSQKEKLEGDLKREIKKLQRQRDQIKNWLSGNDVKDKKQLLENRRLIENAMERFKVVEKNMKTKAFSKEGLSMERIDPKQKEKNETSDFIHQMLEELERQCEKHEANIDQIQNSLKKGKKLDAAKQGEVNDLQELIDRNHWHEEKLEQILRLLANDDLECEQVNELQEDIKYYVESNEDADFIEDETIYDELGLEDAEEAYGNIGDFPQVTPDEPEKETSINSTPKKPSVTSLPSAGLPNINGSSSNLLSQVKSAPVQANTTVASIPTVPSIAATNLKPSIVPKTQLNYSSIALAGGTSNHNTPTISNAQLTKKSPSTPQAEVVPTTVAPPSPSPPPPPGIPEIKTDTSIKNEISRDATQSPTIDPSSSSVLSDLIPNFEKLKQHISKPLPFDEISKILETSLLNCPDSLDSERPRYYEPANPHPTSIHYPQEPFIELSYSSIVQKLDLSTLFYNFYYHQGEYIQILSAKELFKKGWSFDKVTQKWYQRVEEIQPPSLVKDKIMSSENIITWKYFDNEGVWLPRRKDDFNLEAVELQTFI